MLEQLPLTANGKLDAAGAAGSGREPGGAVRKQYEATADGAWKSCWRGSMSEVLE